MARGRRRRTAALAVVASALPRCSAGTPVGGEKEDTFWLHWLACGMGKPTPSTFACSDGVKEDFRVRMVARREIEASKCALARGKSDKHHGTLRILDVGAGPLTTLGTDCGGALVEVIPVDVLAPQYDTTLMRLKLQPRVRTQYAPMEALASHFARGFFDLVHCTNALDHAQDPLRAVQQMVAIAKPRHAVQIISWVNESQSENGFGMHQWDLFADSRHHFMMAHRGGRVVDVTEALSSTARVEVMLKEHVWQQASIPLAQCAALRRARKCVMEVVLTRLSKEGTS